MTKVKFCGLMRKRDIDCANALLPEYVGFVFAQKSIRYVTPEQASRLKEHLHPRILAVGVFVDEDPVRIADLLRAGIIDIAQLHGSESEESCRQLRSLTGKPIIKAFSIGSPGDVDRAQKSAADFVLLDAQRGGSGTRFDWNLIKHLERPFFLAGGLNPDNVRKAVEETHPYAIDVSSGIETDGVKDTDKMRALIDAIRGEEAK